MDPVSVNNQTWSLDRKVTIAGIVSIIGLAASVLTVYVSMNVRLSNVELALTYNRGANDQLRETVRENKAETAQTVAEVKSLIKDVSAKVDRLLERK